MGRGAFGAYQLVISNVQTEAFWGNLDPTQGDSLFSAFSSTMSVFPATDAPTFSPPLPELASSPLLLGNADDLLYPTTADLNGDSRIDLVGFIGQSVVWLEQTTTGSYASASVIIPSNPSSQDGVLDLVPIDLEGDGDTDLIIHAYRNMGAASPILKAVLNDGTGSFDVDNPISFGGVNDGFADDIYISVADVNNDHRLDVIVQCATNKEPLSYFSAGDWSTRIDLALDVPPPATVSAHAVGDVTGDGMSDILVAAGNPAGPTQSLYVFPYINATAYDRRTTITSAVPWITDTSIGLRDMDADGDLDVVPIRAIAYVGWVENEGNSLWTTHLIDTPPNCYSDLGSFNADSRPDLVCSNTSVVQVYLGSSGSASGFASTPVVLTHGFTNNLYLYFVDIDVDGDSDLLGIRYNEWQKLLTRDAFAARPKPSFVPDAGNYACAGAMRSSIECMRASLAQTSLCQRETVVLPPGQYPCSSAVHYTITWPVDIVAEVPGTVTFGCGANNNGQGGVLFHVTNAPDDPDSLGDLYLSGVHMHEMGTASNSLLGAPGLRVDNPFSHLTLDNVTVTGARSLVNPDVPTLQAGTGGAVLAYSGATITAMDSTFAGCTASADGGALAAVGQGSTITLSNSRITDSSAGSHGGGIAVLATGSLLLRDSEVDNNMASGNGGGVSASSGASVVLQSTRVHDNSASRSGGGLSVDTSATLFTTLGEVAGNVAGETGGGVWVSLAVGENGTRLEGTTVSSNTARLGGGMAVVDPEIGTTAAGARTVFDVPRVSPDSGPLSSPLVAVDVTVTENRAYAYGGGALVCGGKMRVSGSQAAWSQNSCSRSNAVGSSADVFACTDSQASTQDVFVAIEPSASHLELQIHGPTMTLEWDAETGGTPGGEHSPGTRVGGRVLGRDVFGQQVVYTRSVVSVAFERVAGLADDSGSEVFLNKLATPVDAVVPGVVDVDNAPFPAVLKVDAVLDANSVGVPVVTPATADLQVVGCSEGFGGVVDETDGSIRCVPCEGGTVSGLLPFDLCVVLDPCPAGSVRLESNLTRVPCQCLPGFWAPDGQGGAGDLCQPCPSGGLCLGSSDVPTSAPGFFPDPENPSLFLACPRPAACTGDGTCATGYVGRLCAECADGWYKLRGQCFECDNSVSIGVAIALVVVALGVSSLLILFSLSSSVRYRFAAVMIGLNSLQITGQYAKLELDWGPVADVYFDVVSSVNLNLELTSPECSVTSGSDVWVLKLVLTLCLPLFVGLAMAALACLFAVLIKAKVGWFASKNLPELGWATIRAWFQSLVLLYLPLTSAAFSVFGCRKDASGRWVLDADPARSCYNGAWWAGLFPLGVVATLVYAVTIPVVVVWILRTRRASLDAISFVLRYGFLVGRFVDHAWFFESVILMRKLSVVVCMTLFFADSSKANAAVFALIGSWGHLVFARPYRSPVHNGLAMVVLGATISVLYAGTFDDYSFRRIGVVSGVVITIVAIVVGTVLDVYLMFVEEKEAEDQEFYGDGLFEFDQHLDANDEEGGGLPHQSFGDSGVQVETIDVAPLVSSEIEMIEYGGVDPNDTVHDVSLMSDVPTFPSSTYFDSTSIPPPPPK